MKRRRKPKVAVRRRWGRSPVTRVVADRRKYDRKRQKLQARREAAQEI